MTTLMGYMGAMRVHAPEIEDEPWCPRWLRDALTGFLQISAEVLRVYDPATEMLAGLVRRHGNGVVVDLCSGGGGPILRLRRLLNDRGVDVAVVLTDLYPNEAAFQRAIEHGEGRVQARFDAVDAADVPDELVGVRTVINGLHHLRPPLARQLVQDAARKRQPFLSVELVERRWQTMLLLMGTPLLALVLSPFQRPLTATRLLLTWVVPVVPLCIWWDGMMSCLRGYSVGELEALVAGLSDDNYRFHVEQVAVPWSPLRLTMLVGEPIAPPM